MSKTYLVNEADLTAIADNTRNLSGTSEGLTLTEVKELIRLEKTYLDATLTALTEKGIEVPEGTTNAGLADLIMNAEFGEVSSFPEFTYTGTHLLIDDGITDEGIQNWRIKFLTSGTLVFTKELGSIDVFLVGGGGGGYGGGGGGGYTTTEKGVVVQTNTDYKIVIGAGGRTDVDSGYDGGSSSAFNITAKAGKGSGPEVYDSAYVGGAGGSGGGGYAGGKGGSDGSNGANGKEQVSGQTGEGGKGQGTTTREFGEETGDLYAGGGGAGGKSPAAGGDGGGGDGSSETAPENGETNTGGGGGGTYADLAGGKGGSGIVIIRNAR